MNDYAIELNGVCKSYRFFDLQNIALRLQRGTIMGLIGPNGAGKSTTIRILMGLVHQDRGEVSVLGHRMPAEQVAAKWDIGFASDDMRLYDSMTLGWHIQFMKSIYASWDDAYAQLLLKRFGNISAKSGTTVFFSSSVWISATPLVLWEPTMARLAMRTLWPWSMIARRSSLASLKG